MQFNLKYREDSLSKVVAVFSIRVHEIHMSHPLFLQIPEEKKTFIMIAWKEKKNVCSSISPFFKR